MLFPHQQEGIAFLRSRSQALLADEMGLGKTVQVLVALAEIAPILIICPASVMAGWEREAARWVPGRSVTLLSGPLEARHQQLQKKLDIVVCNYDVIAKLLPDLRRRSWAALVLDEAHRVKNRKAQVTKAVQVLSRLIPRRYLLTGTPILNRPDDLWSLLNILDPKTYRSYWRFVETFCRTSWNGFGMEVVGVKDPDALARELAPIYLRREKSAVLSLPPRIISQVRVSLEGVQLRQYREMKQRLTTLLESGEQVSAPTVLSQLIRLRQICVDPNILIEGAVKPLSGVKAQALLDLLETSGKVVIFSQWSRVVDATAKLLETRGVAHLVLTGETPISSRAELVDRFQTAPEIKAFITTIGAGGVGITLTAADTAIFLDKSWTPALNAQAIDRLHRPGQQATVWVYEIIARETVEEKVERLLAQKQTWAEELLGRELLQLL
jgi:SNF2 family DNA or RNA helicase